MLSQRRSQIFLLHGINSFFSSTFYTGYLFFRKIISKVAHHKVIKSCIPLVIIIYSLPFSFQISNPGLQMRQLQDPQKPNGNLLLSSCTFDHVMNHAKNKIFFSWFGSQNFSVGTFFFYQLCKSVIALLCSWAFCYQIAQCTTKYSLFIRLVTECLKTWLLHKFCLNVVSLWLAGKKF